MNDVNGQSVRVSQDKSASLSGLPASPGAMLRQARETAGVSVEALAAAMKVSNTKIAGMEADDYSTLPDVVFARALAASICRVFGMDAAPVLALMPKGGEHRLSSTAANINATFKNGPDRSRRNSMLSHATRPLGVAVVVLLLGAAVFALLPYRGDAPETSSGETTRYEPVAKEEPLELPVPLETLSGSLSTPLQGSVSTAQQETVANQTLTPLEAGKSQPAVFVQDSGGVLEFTARGPSWVQVRDASKKVVFERTLAKGEVVSANGTPPFKVVVGRAEEVDIKVRGSQFDLASVAKSGVARFEVK